MIRFGLTPAAFWALSLNEWQWLIAAAFGDHPGGMNAGALQSLLSLYPDKSS